MFSSSYSAEKYHVKVLYQQNFNIAKRFQSLHDARKNSSIRRIENPPADCQYQYVYEDDIRGLWDFARFLRSFGYSVMALEPPQLVDQMLHTYNTILENYEKLEAETNE